MTSIKIAQARNFNGQGELYHFQGTYDEAKKCFESAFTFLNEAHQVHQKSDIDNCDSCCANIAAIYHNQAKLYDDLGNYDQAERLYQKALNISEIRLDKPEIGASLVELHYNLARLYHFRWHEYTEATRHYKQALDCCKKYLGTDSPEASLIRANQVQLALDRAIDTPQNENNQISPYYHDTQNAYKSAVDAYQTAIDQKTSYAHSRLASCLNNLGVTYYLSGKLEDAKQQFERARLIYEDREWTSHFSYAVIVNNLAKIWQKQKDHCLEAHRWFKVVEQIYRKADDSYYPFYQVADFLTDYAQYFLEINCNKAIELLQEAIKIYRCQRPLLGHDGLLWALKYYRENYSRSSLKCCKPGELYDEMLTEYERYGTDNPQTANVRRSYAHYLGGNNDNNRARQQYDLALNAYNQALCIYMPTLDLRDHWARQDSGPTVKDGRVVLVLREIELTLKDYTPLLIALRNPRVPLEAENIYKNALKSYKSILGSGHWLVADVYGDYSAYLDERGDRGKARGMADEARSIRTLYSKRIYNLHSDAYVSKNEIYKLDILR